MNDGIWKRLCMTQRMIRVMKTKAQINKRLDFLMRKYHEANFRNGPIIGKLINELEWVIDEELTNFD